MKFEIIFKEKNGNRYIYSGPDGSSSGFCERRNKIIHTSSELRTNHGRRFYDQKKGY